MLAGHVECVKVLIEHGANVNASNDTGYVPLHVAVHNHHLLCIQGVSVSVGVSPCLCCCAVPVPGPPFGGRGFFPVLQLSLFLFRLWLPVYVIERP